MNDNVLPLPDDPRLVQAAQWRIRLAEAGIETSPAFEMWMLDPLNRAAWEQVCGPWDFFGDVALEPELLSARQNALGDVFQREKADRPMRRMARAAALLLAATSAFAQTPVKMRMHSPFFRERWRSGPAGCSPVCFNIAPAWRVSSVTA